MTEFRRILEAMAVDSEDPNLHVKVTISTRQALLSLLEALDQQALESVIFRRVAGDAICGGCWLAYNTHEADDEFPWLTRACLGQLVKL